MLVGLEYIKENISSHNNVWNALVPEVMTATNFEHFKRGLNTFTEVKASHGYKSHWVYITHNIRKSKTVYNTCGKCNRSFLFCSHFACSSAVVTRWWLYGTLVLIKHSSFDINTDLIAIWICITSCNVKTKIENATRYLDLTPVALHPNQLFQKQSKTPWAITSTNGGKIR